MTAYEILKAAGCFRLAAIPYSALLTASAWLNTMATGGHQHGSGNHRIHQLS